jgi:hypothetical protein
VELKTRLDLASAARLGQASQADFQRFVTITEWQIKILQKEEQ